MKQAIKTMPRRGHEGESILSRMEELRGSDANWEDGKVFCLVYNAGEEISTFLKRAYGTYFSENGLNPTAFPGLKRMENEVVSMVAHLLGSDGTVVGNMTSGGTESILMAVKMAREWGKHRRWPWKRTSKPEMILPVSAHPAFEKAAHYFGVKAVHVPLDDDYRVNLKAVRRAINRNTVMLVGSAPQYPQGVVDPISELGQLALKHDILLHVDSCVGGMMLPFVRELGYEVPPFDFRVPGVTTMSADLHKYGYAAKGASTILYRSEELRRHAFFAYTSWPGGIYVSPSMLGTRPGGAIAAAWAVMHKIGFEGYVAMAREVMGCAERLRDGIASIDGIDVLGSPHMSVMCIGADDLDIFEVGDNMSEKGWHMDRQQGPDSLHLTVSASHLQSADAFLVDLREAVARARDNAAQHRRDRLKYKAIHTALRLIPGPVANTLTGFASKHMGMGDGLPKRTAAMYGMMGSLPDRGALEPMVIDLLQNLTRYDGAEGELLPDDGDR